MRKALPFCMLLFCTNAFAYDPLSYDFTAPVVYDVSTISSPQSGLIVYDSSDNTFKGKSASSTGWQTLSPITSSVVVANVNSSYTALTTDDVVLADATGATLTVGLPAAAA